MPELAEVEHFRRRWNEGIGDRVLRVFARKGKRVFRGESTAILVRDLGGARLEASHAHGKQLLFTFTRPTRSVREQGPGSRRRQQSGSEQPISLGVHLGMTGALRVEPPTHRPKKHDHLVLYQETRALVFTDPRLFGRIRFSATHEPAWWADLPTQVLSSGFTVQHVARFLERRARSPIKPVLLDQRGFPGIGNWMADEILWRARIHPRRLAGTLLPAEVVRIRQETRFVCRGALRFVAPSFGDPPGSWLFVHRWKDGGRCPATGVVLVRATIGGRTTCWSPALQPDPDQRTTKRAARAKPAQSIRAQ